MAGKDNIIGMAMGLDVTDLKAGINEVKKIVKQSNDEFKLATAGLDKWTQSADGLTAKVKQLEKQLDAQNKAVAGYKAEIERVSKLEGDHTVQLEQLKKKLTDAEIAVKKTESQITKYNTSLSQVNAENKKAESSFGQLTKEIEEQKAELSELEFAYKDAVLTYGKNSKEAKALAKQITSLNGELEDNQSEVKKADKQLELLEKQFDDTEEEAADFGSALDNIKGLGATVAKGITAIGATIGGLATAFFATAESTRELRTNMGKVETAFTTAGLSAEQATKTYQDLYAVVADEGKATEATSHIAKLAKSQEDLKKWTEICTGVYATFGDSLPIENLAEASNETAKTGKITGGLADALNWAGVSEEKFQEKLDSLSTEQERNKLITETLNGLYAEASQKYQQTNKDVIESNKAQAELSNTMAELGAKAEPLLTSIKNGFNQLLQAVIELVNGADFEGIKAGIENAFKYAIDTIIPAIVDGFQWIMDNKDTLIAGIVAVGSAMLAWNVVSMIQGVVSAIKAWTVATEGMTVAQKLLNLAMKANPIGIVITLITALVAAFITLWNTSDEFRAFWINLWNKIKETTSKAVKTIKEWFSNLWSDIKKIWGSTVDWFKNIGSKIASGFQKALNSTKEFFSNAWKSIKNAWSSVASWFSNIGNKISNGFKTATTNVKNFFSNTWNNIKKVWNVVISWFVNIGTKISNGFKNATNNIKNFFSNTWNNIKKVWNVVISWFSNIASKVVNAFKNIPTNIKNFFSNAWNNVKNIWSGVSGWFSNIKEKIVNAFKSIPSSLKNFFVNAWNNIKSAWSNPAQFFNDVKEKIINKFKELPSRMLSVGKDLIRGLWNGVKDMTSWITGKLDSFGDSVLNGIKNFFGIHSPSRVMAEIGRFLAQGLGIGLEDEAGVVAKAGIKTGEAYKDGVVSVAEGILGDYKTVADDISDIEISPTVEDKDYWDNFIDECGKALGLTGKQLDKWSIEVKKKVSKIGNVFSQIGSKIGELGNEIINAYNANLENQSQQLDYELEKFNEAKDAELEKQEETYENEVELLKEALANKQISDETYKARLLELDNNLAENQKRIEAEKRQAEQETLIKKNEIAQKQFNSQKATSIAEATVQGALAIVKGFAELGAIGGAINAGVQAGITAAQIATISKQKYVPMLAKGGIVDGATLAVIGEQGKEAVMPLENNTGWINELAFKLNEIMQRDFVGDMKQASIVYQGDTVVNNYNTYNQTINSPTALSRKEIYRDSKNLLALKGV